MKKTIAIIGILLIALFAIWYFLVTKDSVPVAIDDKSGLIRVNSPKPNEIIKSPLVVTGEARGSWFFEASFPVILTDWDGKMVAQGVAQAQSDWMTADFVPYEAKLIFTVSPSVYNRKGTLILKKDNPSGLPANDASLEIPVFFAGDTPVYNFPKTLPTVYISPSDWPPNVQLIDKQFVCNETGSEVLPAGKTEKKIINGRTYCVTTESEGAAGSVYNQYTYAFAQNAKTVILTFGLRFVQCANYDEPRKTACETERQTFNVDNFIADILKGV